ncbi:hypothetical protein J4732_18825 [Serratia marcescens]|uniref:Uncharacterized protein n=1 Tax=Serratia marcescens TaxID=615 RepID=A0A939SRF4_SERMA|nr:hypothetical protein [Serratia marcescens]
MDLRGGHSLHRPDGGARHRAIRGAAYRDHFTPCFTPTAPQTVHWPQMPMLADYALRDYARPDNGGIVCHCELVTQRKSRQCSIPPCRRVHRRAAAPHARDDGAL